MYNIHTKSLDLIKFCCSTPSYLWAIQQQKKHTYYLYLTNTLPQVLIMKKHTSENKDDLLHECVLGNLHFTSRADDASRSTKLLNCIKCVSVYEKFTIFFLIFFHQYMRRVVWVKFEWKIERKIKWTLCCVCKTWMKERNY